MSNNDIKIEDIQYGLVLGSDINTVKEALWMTWRSWVEVYQARSKNKPRWTSVYNGWCPCCAYIDANDAGCELCPMLRLWIREREDLEYYDAPCIALNGSPYAEWEDLSDSNEVSLGHISREVEHPAKIIADFAFNLLKKECYGTKELAGPQEPNEPD